MGDRANFGFIQPSGDAIVLYGHWAGYDMLSHLANALEAARTRWTDPAYATRIAVSQLVGEDWNQELSWGLHINEIGDNEHKVPMVNWMNQTVSLHEDTRWQNLDTKFNGIADEPIFTMTLDSFCNKYSGVVTSV
jgi:alpha-ketoglutarate-dependent taurine dioxygenase